MNRIVIAVDGPAGAGKSSISKQVAERLKIEYIDTGAMYRAVTLKLMKCKVSPKDVEKVAKILEDTTIVFENKNVIMDGKDVSKEIRTPEVNRGVSEVAAIPVVRERLVELQRAMADKCSVIMDGRDIGTNVLKDAPCKIYLTASVEERARRRCKQLNEEGVEANYEETCKAIAARDKYDSERELNPLMQAEDAVLVDSTNMTIDEVVQRIIDIAGEV